MASKIRRELLALHMADGDVDEVRRDVEDQHEAEAAEATEASAPLPVAQLKTEDGQRSLQDLERKLQDASRRAEEFRRQLDGYVDDLRSKTFFTEDAEDREGGLAQEPEPLVALPAPDDLDDLVDLSAASGRRHRTTRAKAKPQREKCAALARGSAKASASDAVAVDTWKMPSFLEKYFSEEKGLEQVPLKAIRAEEEQRVGGRADSEHLEKGLRQIARLDSLLASREAACSARLKAAQAQYETAQQRLKREAEEIERKKTELVETLKQRGLLKASGAAAPGRGVATSVPSSTRSSNSNSVAVALRETPSTQLSVASTPTSRLEVETVPVDWSGWASSAPGEAPASSRPSPTASTPSPAPSLALLPRAAGQAPEAPPTPSSDDDYDTSTFNLTSTTGTLPETSAGPSLGRAGSGPARASAGTVASGRSSGTLAPVQEGEEGADDTTRLALPAFDEDGEAIYGADVSTLDELSRIDEQLRQLVPESEWEAKSITTYDRGSVTDASGAEKQSVVRSVWSRPSQASALEALPGDPVLREHMELREAQQAMTAVEDRLRDLLALPAPSGAEPLAPEAIRQLLLQAVQQAPAAAAADKVLALTADAASLGGAASSLALTEQAIVPARLLLPEEEPLRQAQDILNRLLAERDAGDDDLKEAEFIMQELEADVQILEAKRQAEAEAESTTTSSAIVVAAPALPDAGLFRPLAQRVESLAEEARGFLEKPSMDEATLARLRELASEPRSASAAEERGEGRASRVTGPALLSSAVQGQEEVLEDDDDDDLLSLFSGEFAGPGGDALDEDLDAELDVGDEDEGLASPLRAEESAAKGPPSSGRSTSLGGSVAGLPAEGSVAASTATPTAGVVTGGPSMDLLRALDIELPSGEGRWADEDLERIVRVMDEHYGDVPPPLPDDPDEDEDEG